MRMKRNLFYISMQALRRFDGNSEHASFFCCPAHENFLRSVGQKFFWFENNRLDLGAMGRRGC